jgi:nucleoside-diphosphate-sugar epimerase
MANNTSLETNTQPDPPQTAEREGAFKGLILVTGASGFLGQHLVRHLSAQGKSVRALYNSNPPSESLRTLPNTTWLPCDLLDVFQVEEVMEGVEYVYHCAAMVSFHPAHKDRMVHFNVEGTTNVVNEALLQGVRKLLYVSSVAALGRSEEKKEITEEEQWEESKYNSSYGLSKHMAELEVWRALGEGLDGVVVNPGIILGEGNWNEGSARLMKVVYNEFPFYTSGINAWVDVRDVVKAMVQLMDSGVTAERFILSAGNFSYKEIFSKMADALGRKPPSIKAGKLLTGLVWRWSLLKANFFGETATITKETARSSQKQVFYNAAKLLKYLPGFSYTDIGVTINRMALTYKEDLRVQGK